MNAIDILKERGFLYQLTDEEATRKKLEEGPQTFYIGFDPTADSLHVGHLLPVMGIKKFTDGFQFIGGKQNITL